MLSAGEESFKVLIVDDDAVNRRVLFNHLALESYRLIEAADGRQALEALAYEQDFDLVLLDIMMPEMSGYEVCRKIRENKSIHELPIIYLSARDQVDDLVEGFASGANDYLTKPISKGELLARVNTHLMLLDTNRNLERKVAERTATLDQANQELDRRVRELDGKNRELAQKNEAILQAQNQLVISEKMATLGTLTAGVAHEFNNPNTFIKGGLQALESELSRFKQMLAKIAGEESDQEVVAMLMKPFQSMADYAEIIRRGTARISDVVVDMRNISRLDEAEFKSVDLLSGLRAIVGLTHSQYPAVTIRLELGEPLIRECRPGELNQVYLNIILNACRAIEDRLRVEPHAAAVLTIQSRREGEQAVICFSDTGCGIPHEHQDKIFEAFFTTREPGDGTGLGLYSAWRIMEQHGGGIEVDSELGQGACFTLRLGLAQ